MNNITNNLIPAATAVFSSMQSFAGNLTKGAMSLTNAAIGAISRAALSYPAVTALGCGVAATALLLKLKASNAQAHAEPAHDEVAPANVAAPAHEEAAEPVQEEPKLNRKQTRLLKQMKKMNGRERRESRRLEKFVQQLEQQNQPITFEFIETPSKSQKRRERKAKLEHLSSVREKYIDGRSFADVVKGIKK